MPALAMGLPFVYAVRTVQIEVAVRTTGVEEARKRLPEILSRANRDGTVTIVTKRGVPYAAIVPVSQVVREAPKLTALRGSARGYYGEAAECVARMRDEWQ